MFKPRNALAVAFIAAGCFVAPLVRNAAADELLLDPGFEDPREITEEGNPWNAFNNPPTPTVNATSDPRSGAEHAELVLDTSQLFDQFGPTIRSTVFAESGPAMNVTNFTGMTLDLTNHFKVTAFNMSSPDPESPPSVVVRTYLAYFGAPGIGFLGFSSGFDDQFPEAITADYQPTMISFTVPNFGTPVRSVDFTFGLIAPDTDLGQMTGTATVIFDDVSLMAGLPVTADYNGNTIVDAADFTVWRDSLGMTGLQAFALGDGNGDTEVMMDDYELWRSQFGRSTMGAGGVLTSAFSVPEPCALLLLSQCLVLRLANRSRRRASFLLVHGVPIN